jgi:hypothetical protein
MFVLFLKNCVDMFSNKIWLLEKNAKEIKAIHNMKKREC